MPETVTIAKGAKTGLEFFFNRLFSLVNSNSIASMAIVVVCGLTLFPMVGDSLAAPLSLQDLAVGIQKNATANNNLIRRIAVFGKDQRRRLPQKYQKLSRQIGLLHNPRTNTLCTAFCVSPDTIATASHCLFSHRKNKSLHLSSFIFKLTPTDSAKPVYARLAGYQNRQSRRYIITGTSHLNRTPPIGAARDWTIARLEYAACRYGWLRIFPINQARLESRARRKKLFQVAYHMDFGDWDIAYSRSCPVRRSYGKLSWKNIRKHFSLPRSLILHRCDTGEASSGSPILMDTSKGPVVVGINVGTYQQRNITVKNGRIIHRSKFRTIANTAVNANAFARNILMLKSADIIKGAGKMKLLQRHLRERGYYHGAIDGVYGSRTELAIKSFERSLRRPVTGLATRTTLLALTRHNSEPASINTTDGRNTLASQKLYGKLLQKH